MYRVFVWPGAGYVTQEILFKDAPSIEQIAIECIKQNKGHWISYIKEETRFLELENNENELYVYVDYSMEDTDGLFEKYGPIYLCIENMRAIEEDYGIY